MKIANPRLHKKRTAEHPGFNAVANKISHNKNPHTGKHYTKEQSDRIAGSIYRKQLAKKRHK